MNAKRKKDMIGVLPKRKIPIKSHIRIGTRRRTPSQHLINNGYEGTLNSMI